MKNILLTFSFTIILLVLGCTDKKKQKATAEPYKLKQTIFFNGDIITMEGETPQYTEALVQQEGKIVFVGDKTTALEKYPNAEKKDLNGKTMLPGFIDGHSHIYNVGFMGLMGNILPAPDGECNNYDQLVQIMNTWKNSSNGQFIINKIGWIIGNGYDDSQLNEKEHPTKEILDKISTEIPVVVIHQSGHLASVNSKALELAGYNKDSKIEGGIIRKDKNGNPTGILEEAAFFNIILPIVAEKTDSELQALCVQKAQEEYAKNGYLTAQDGRTTSEASAAFVTAARDNKLYIDIVSYPDIIWNEAAVTPEFYNKNHSYKNHYRVGGVKLTLDGSPQGKTAWLTKCYHRNPIGRTGCYEGYPIMSDEKATEHVKKAFKNQWQIICHTNGDAAIDQFMNAIQAAQEEFGYDDHRSVVIHGQTIRKDQLEKAAANNTLISFYPAHTFYWGDWHAASVLGHPRADYISPCRDAIDMNINITSHHDAPVIPPSSMRVLDAPVNRVTRSGVILGADQRISPYESLKTLTIWSAIQHFEEDTKGTLAAGKLADLVILDKNPLKVNPMDIHTIQVLESIKEGETVYKKN